MRYESGNSCEICTRTKIKLHSCKMCGANVCDECFIAEEKLCNNCHEAKCQICGEYLASRACNKCGKLVCEDHGIKMNESTLCEICWKSDE